MPSWCLLFSTARAARHWRCRLASRVSDETLGECYLIPLWRGRNKRAGRYSNRRTAGVLGPLADFRDADRPRTRAVRWAVLQIHWNLACNQSRFPLGIRTRVRCPPRPALFAIHQVLLTNQAPISPINALSES